MKKLTFGLILLLSFSSYSADKAVISKRCTQLNKLLAGTQYVTLSARDGSFEVNTKEEFKKTSDYNFERTVYDTEGNLLIVAHQIILKKIIKKCYFFNSSIEDESNQMIVGPVHGTFNPLNNDLAEAELYNSEGITMFLSSIEND